MRRLEIDRSDALLVATRDYPFSNPKGEVYLDLKTGEFLWVYEESVDHEGRPYLDLGHDACYEESMIAENREILARIESDGKRYLLIPPLSHGDHHAMFREFVDGLDDAPVGYFGSIGGWFRKVERDFGKKTADRYAGAWNAYMEEKCLEYLLDFIRKNGGVEPVLVWRKAQYG